MSKQKIREHIVAAVTGRVAPKTLIPFDIKHDRASSTDHVRHRIDFKVGAMVEGPASQSTEIMNEVISLIVHELYGDILNDIYELRAILIQTNYMTSDHPVMQKLLEMQDKVRP